MRSRPFTAPKTSKQKLHLIWLFRNRWYLNSVRAGWRPRAHSSLTESAGPEDLNASRTIISGRPAATAYQMLFGMAGIKRGDRVLIHQAAGGVGLRSSRGTAKARSARTSIVPLASPMHRPPTRTSRIARTSARSSSSPEGRVPAAREHQQKGDGEPRALSCRLPIVSGYPPVPARTRVS